MTISVYSEAIAQSFSKAVRTYDCWAFVQSDSAHRLIEMIPQNVDAKSVLDIGCGTGFLTEMLLQRFSDADILGIDVAPGMVQACMERWRRENSMLFLVADVEDYVSERKFDIIASNFSFQWFSNPEATIEQCTGMINPGGTIAIAVPIHGSLVELNTSYEAVIGEKMPGLDFTDSNVYKNALEKSGIELVIAQEEVMCAYFHGAMNVMRSFKGTGTSFQHFANYRPRSSREIRKIVLHYEDSFKNDEGKVPVSFNVLIIIGKYKK